MNMAVASGGATPDECLSAARYVRHSIEGGLDMRGFPHTPSH